MAVKVASQVSKVVAPKKPTTGLVRPLKVELSSDLVQALHNPARPAPPAPAKAAGKPIAKPVSAVPTNLGARLAATTFKPASQTASPTRSLTWGAVSTSASTGAPVGASASAEVTKPSGLGANLLGNPIVNRVEGAVEATGRAVEQLDPVENLERGSLWARRQQGNFQLGVLEWGKDNADPLLHLVQNPVESARAIDRIANNVVINPAGAFMRGAVDGKTPLQVINEDLGEWRTIGEATVADYTDVYRDHGVAGVAGYLAPDLALAILTAGEGNAARASGRQFLRDVAVEAVPVPGPADIPGFVDTVRQQND